MTQHYVGTKQVIGLPMTRQAYNDYRGWQLPANENGADEGYLVEYVDGGPANDPRHVGYISWSPKDVFEGSYLPIGDVGSLPPHQQRVVAEKAQLDDKLSKLRAFMAREIFKTLPELEQERLSIQANAMEVYSFVLGERIAAFGDGQ